MEFGIVNITSFCNQKCIFCSEGEMHNTPKNIPFDKVIRILEDLKKNGVKGVNFMGGECTMRSDLGDILDFCRQNFKFVSIVTNGVMFMNYKRACDILGKVRAFEFSWHTTKKDKFELLSGSETYDLFLKALPNVSKILLEKKELGIIVNHVINKINFEDIPEFVKTVSSTFDMSKKENRLIALKRTNIVGDSIKNSDLLAICPSKVLPYLYDAVKFCVENHIYVQIEGFPPCYFSDFFSSEFFQTNEMDEMGLYLLNKVDISKVQDVKKHKQFEDFSSEIYKKGNVMLNMKILDKCRKCIFRKKCHTRILLSDDANKVSNDIVSCIGKPIILEDLKRNMEKRDIFLKSFV